MCRRVCPEATGILLRLKRNQNVKFPKKKMVFLHLKLRHLLWYVHET
jgi:hypothetical protein